MKFKWSFKNLFPRNCSDITPFTFNSALNKNKSKIKSILFSYQDFDDNGTNVVCLKLLVNAGEREYGG